MKKITTRTILRIDKHGIRLNHPSLQGILGRIDRWVFNYSWPRRKYFYVPCFLPLLKMYKQLVIDNVPVYMGGGVNCFNEPNEIVPVIISKEELQQCIEANTNGYWRIRRFEYNGFYGRLKKGHIKEVAISIVETNDPGIYKCMTNKGSIIYAPSYAIEGIQLIYKVKENNNIPCLFGIVSATI